MTREAYACFLKTALPRLGLRWSGFRRVRSQVCKRIQRRFRELGLQDLPAYAAYLVRHAEEWAILDSCCRITISRFYRDRDVFETLCLEVLPGLARSALAEGQPLLRCWSAGCASGEEAYSVKMLWVLCLQPRFPELDLHLLATDVDQTLLERARRGRYARGSLRDLPSSWLKLGFVDDGACHVVRDQFRDHIDFVAQDIRRQLPEERFHLILCRNLAWTYFAASLQRDLLARLVERLVPGGFLVVGKDETPPVGGGGLRPLAAQPAVWQKAAPQASLDGSRAIRLGKLSPRVSGNRGIPDTKIRQAPT